MNPIRKTIRELEKQLKTARPAVRKAAQRVIFGLTVILLNQKNPEGLKLAHRALLDDVAALEKARKA